MTSQPWLATYRANHIPHTIDPDAHTSVVHMFEDAMVRCADHPAFRAFGQTLNCAAAFAPNGHFRSGDVGVVTPEGYLKLVERNKDMVIVSGFDVWLNEIEAVAMLSTSARTIV